MILQPELSTKGSRVKSSEVRLEAEESKRNENVSLRDSPQRWLLAFLLVVGMIFLYAQRGALSVAAPFMIRDLNLSPTVMGILLSAFFWSYSLMQIPAGWLVDRFGVKRTYAFGFAFWSFITALTGIARSLTALVFVRVLLGVGQSVAFPASARAVANWFPDRERGTVTATYLAGVRVGQALVSAVGAFLLKSYGWKFFFVGIGVVPLVWLLPWYLFLHRWENTTRTASKQITPRPKASLLKSLSLLKNRSVLGIFLGFFAYDYAWFVYVSWLPSYLIMERKFGTREMGIYSSIPYLAMSIIILLSGFVSDGLIRRGYSELRIRKSFIIMGMSIGCLIVPGGWVSDPMTSVWFLSISLCGLGLCSPNTWTLTQSVCSKNVVGTVSGIQNFGGNIGGILAPVLTGYIAQVSNSFTLALSITGCILVGGIFSYGFLVSGKVQLEEV